jgi:hypothetical protein
MFGEAALFATMRKVKGRRVMTKMKIAGAALSLVVLSSCSGPPKPTTPALTPELAQQLLNYDERAQNFITHVKTKNPACAFSLTLPDQIPPLTQIDLEHIVTCSNRPAPLEFDASVTFLYDPVTGKWMLKRFSS